MSKSKYAWGWERPEQKRPDFDQHAWINWKWDKVYPPMYDFGKEFGPYTKQAPINYNYNDWWWGNWRWLNDV